MRKLVLLAHLSLDGFVAGPNGELDGFPSDEENLGFVCDLTKNADAALFGRKSYELLDKYWPGAKDLAGVTKYEVDFSNWYNTAEKIVASNTLSGQDRNNIKIIHGDIAGEVSKIKQQPGKEILIFGSPSVSRQLMQSALIDSYWIFINPVIFTEGIPLFSGLSNKIKLRPGSSREFANGEIAINYTL